MRRAIVGLDGPMVAVPAEVAFLAAPVLRVWLNDERASGRRCGELVEAIVAALELLADHHRHALMSDTGPPSGHPLPVSKADPALSVQEASKALGVTERQVRRLIDQGLLTEVSRPGRMRWVDRASVLRVQRQRGNAA